MWSFIVLVTLAVRTQSLYILNCFHNLFWGRTDTLLDVQAPNNINSKSIVWFFFSVIFVKIVSGRSHNVMLNYLMHICSLKDIHFCWEFYIKRTVLQHLHFWCFQTFLQWNLKLQFILKYSRGNITLMFWCFHRCATCFFHVIFLIT